MFPSPSSNSLPSPSSHAAQGPTSLTSMPYTAPYWSFMADVGNVSGFCPWAMRLYDNAPLALFVATYQSTNSSLSGFSISPFVSKILARGAMANSPAGIFTGQSTMS